MTNYDLKEAFQEMALLNEAEDFNLSDSEQVEKLKNFLIGDEFDEVQMVVDVDAEGMDDLQPSYEGKLILQCPICKSLIYKDEEDVVKDEESEYVNVEEACPYCKEDGGYFIVGKVAPYSEHPEEAEGEVKGELKAEEDDEDLEVKDEIKAEESLTEEVGLRKFGDGKTPSWEIGGRNNFEIYTSDFNRDRIPQYKASRWSCTYASIQEMEDDIKNLQSLIAVTKELEAKGFTNMNGDLKEEVAVDTHYTLTEDLTHTEEEAIGYIEDQLLDLEDNLAYKLASLNIGYNPDWCNEDGSNGVSRQAEIGRDTYIDALRKVLFYYPLTESKKADEALTEEDKPAAISIADCQKWVDYDMERYGKISDRTNKLVQKAGFQIIKDDHGDYEVAAGKFESLTEDKHDLPDMCYIDVATGGIGIVKKGESGYYQTDLAETNNVSGKEKAELVDKLNKKLGVTKAQAQAMQVGSMFGWHVPGADPAKYEGKFEESKEVCPECGKEPCECKECADTKLTEASEVIDQKGFATLVKYSDPVFANASHGVLNDGNFCYKFWAKDDEEAKKIFAERGVECKEDYEDSALPTNYVLELDDETFAEITDPNISEETKFEYVTELVNNHLADNYGFTNYGWDYNIDTDNHSIIVSDIEWDTDESFEDLDTESLDKLISENLGQSYVTENGYVDGNKITLEGKVEDKAVTYTFEAKQEGNNISLISEGFAVKGKVENQSIICEAIEQFKQDQKLNETNMTSIQGTVGQIIKDKIFPRMEEVDNKEDLIKIAEEELGKVGAKAKTYAAEVLNNLKKKGFEAGSVYLGNVMLKGLGLGSPDVKEELKEEVSQDAITKLVDKYLKELRDTGAYQWISFDYLVDSLFYEYDIEATADQVRKALDDLHIKTTNVRGEEVILNMVDPETVEKDMDDWNPIKEDVSLTEKKWDMEISAGVDLRKAIDEEDGAKIKSALIKCYKEINEKNSELIDEDELENLIEDLEAADFEVSESTPSEAEVEGIINNYLTDFYDFCDGFNIWVGI